MTSWSETLHTALDELAMLLVIGGPADRARIGALIGQVVEALPLDAPAPLRDRVDALVNAASKHARDPSSSGLSEAIVAVQSALVDLALTSPEAPRGRAAELGLHEWVDESILNEYLGSAKLALEALEGALLATESGESEAIRNAGALLHGIKGEAGTVGLDEVSTLGHAMEDALGSLPSAELLERLLSARDWLAQRLDRLAHGGPRPGDPSEIIRLLQAPAEAVNAPLDEETAALFLEFHDESMESLGKADGILVDLERGDAQPDAIHALFRTFHSIKGVASFLEQQFVARLAHATEEVLGQVRESIAPYDAGRSDAVFEATTMLRRLLTDMREAIAVGRGSAEPQGFGALVARLRSLLVQPNADGAAAPVHAHVAPAHAHVHAAAAPAPVHPAGAHADLVGEPRDDAAEAIAVATPAAFTPPTPRAEAPHPAAPVATGPRVSAPIVPAAAGAPAPAAAAPAAEGDRVALKNTVKVDLERVDALVELIGELAIIETMVAHDPEIAALSSQRVRHRLAQLSKVSRDLQRRGLGLRMVPLNSVFQKMSRLVRDVGRRADKPVRLLVTGEATEMDRSLVEQINDPLVHLVRNAIDHGLETAAGRTAAGKPPVGTIELRAGQEGGNIVITIRDDGRGLNRERILARAVDRGLIPAAAAPQMPDREVWELIFSPGFSTAEKVTEISGRGVGMDVVRKNVEAMRGRIRIDTVEGQGSSFHLILPLTLAIIDGMLFRCGDERFVLPTHAIVEAMVPEPGMIRRYADQSPVLFLRGELLTVLHLGSMLGASGPCASAEDGLLVIVETTSKRIAVVVDEVLGQQQVVIKTLSGVATQGGRFNGAAILSDGSVGLILDPSALVGERAPSPSEFAA